MAAKDGKAVAQVLDSKRDHSEARLRLLLAIQTDPLPVDASGIIKEKAG
jgi:hypothetical protein